MISKQNINEYGIEQIKHLGAMEAIRTRPGMYIGSIGPEGMFQIVLEVISNSIDEYLNGYGTKIKITLHKDGSISVEDNGRGMPIGIMEDGEHSLVALLTQLHTGGKFGDEGYNSSGGLNGVGIKATNALSEWLTVISKREGKIYEADFARGEVTSNPKVVGKTKETGTTLHFLPDTEIFGDNKINFELIKKQVEELSFLCKGMKFELENEITEEKIEYLSKNGLLDYLKYLNEGNKAIHKNPFYCENEIEEEGFVEVAMQYNNTSSEKIKLYTNNIPNSSGTHLTGFRTCLTKIVNEFARKEKLLKEKDSNLTGEDLKEGLSLIISIKFPEPVFDGQTKDKLTDTRGRAYTSKVVTEALKQYFENFKEDMISIINKAILAGKARQAAKKAREIVKRKGNVNAVAVLPGKLTDCQNAGKLNSEIYLVEGDSAGGNLKNARDKKTQAVLPLRGKILNAQKNDLTKLLNNNEIKSMIAAFGCGIGEEFDISKLRYEKIILMTDADVDGAHIRTLLLTFLFKYMRPLIELGYVYSAVAPLYIVTYRNNKIYMHTEKEVNAFLKEHPSATSNYLKGLGEMDPDELWETTIDPENRQLIQFKIEDEELTEEIFSTLMGTKVAPRRAFITENARYAKVDS